MTLHHYLIDPEFSNPRQILSMKDPFGKKECESY